jgi:hypothetical protein
MNIFYEKLDSYINTLDIKKRSKYVIRNDMYSTILKVLKLEDLNQSSKLKFWIKKNFRIIEIGQSQIVYTIKNNLPLVTYEDMYEKISESHIAVGHSGRDKTWSQVIIIFYLIFNKMFYIG